MAEQLRLTLTTGEDVYMDVEDAANALHALGHGLPPFNQPWLEIDADTRIRGNQIVAVRVDRAQSVGPA